MRNAFWNQDDFIVMAYWFSKPKDLYL